MNPLETYLDQELLEIGVSVYSDASDLEGLLQCDILNFCGCGLPENNLKFIYDFLTLEKEFYNARDAISHLYIMGKDKHISDALWKKYEGKRRDLIASNAEAVFYFIAYVMNEKNIMEHGGSVPGWICDHNFYDALKKWHDEEYLKEETQVNE